MCIRWHRLCKFKKKHSHLFSINLLYVTWLATCFDRLFYLCCAISIKHIIIKQVQQTSSIQCLQVSSTVLENSINTVCTMNIYYHWTVVHSLYKRNHIIRSLFEFHHLLMFCWEMISVVWKHLKKQISYTDPSPSWTWTDSWLIDNEAASVVKLTLLWP